MSRERTEAVLAYFAEMVI